MIPQAPASNGLTALQRWQLRYRQHSALKETSKLTQIKVAITPYQHLRFVDAAIFKTISYQSTHPMNSRRLAFDVYQPISIMPVTSTLIPTPIVTHFRHPPDALGKAFVSFQSPLDREISNPFKFAMSKTLGLGGEYAQGLERQNIMPSPRRLPRSIRKQQPLQLLAEARWS